MSKVRKAAQKFVSEAEECAYWEREDSASGLDWRGREAIAVEEGAQAHLLQPRPQALRSGGNPLASS